MYGYGSGYMQGLGGYFQPTGMSAQGAGMPFSQTSVAGGTPAWMGASQAQLMGGDPAMDTFGAIGQSPEWLQQYMNQSLIKEGQAGFYDPTLQLRDMYSSLQPQMGKMMGLYGMDTFNNPEFLGSETFKAYNDDPSYFSQGGQWDPFSDSPWHIGYKDDPNQLGSTSYSSGRYESGKAPQTIHYNSRSYMDPWSGKQWEKKF